ncbi:MAG: tetratricopeptide repeat protein [Myxococcota bacterium]|nr:tetratricopeptide repeat protein [Myxococcota bacterium]
MNESFESVLAQARKNSEDLRAWESLESLVVSNDETQEVAKLYREVLDSKLSEKARLELSRRAVRFHDEWFGDDLDVIINLLRAVCETTPKSGWALERLTVALTDAERWDELLGLYDRLLATTDDDVRRHKLLEDAIQVAKDFAGEQDRAIGYMRALLDLEPVNDQLASNIERIAVKLERWSVVVELLRGRMGVLPPDQVLASMARIAEITYAHLGQPGQAIDELRPLLERAPGHAEGCILLKRIFGDDGVPPTVRGEALTLLRTNYEATGRVADVVQALEQALAFAQGEQAVPLRREAASRLAIAGQDKAAMLHYAELLKYSATDTNARKELRLLAQRSGLHEVHVQALIVAAAHCADPNVRDALLADAGQVFAGVLDDTEKAVDLYEQVLLSEAADPHLCLGVAHRLNLLYDQAGRTADRLIILERIAELEPTAAVRRHVLGEAGRLAESLGEDERALAIWKRRLDDDPNDLEAIGALVTLLESLKSWSELVLVLRQRAAVAPLPMQGRVDLVRSAQILSEHLDDTNGAIELWLEVRERFGHDAESVEALDALFIKAGRFSDLAQILGEITEEQHGRVIRFLIRLGEVAYSKLDDPSRAAREFGRALELDPQSKGLRAGLKALLEVPSTRAAACSALLRAMERTDDWQGTIDLLEVRLAVAKDALSKVYVLDETAELLERRARDATTAIKLAAQALPLAPDSPSILGRLERLAQDTQEWEVAALAFEEAASVCVVPHCRVDLYRREALILRDQLGDSAGAATAMGHVVQSGLGTLDDVNALMQLAALSGSWAIAVEAALSLGKARGRVSADERDFLESTALVREELPALAEAMASLLEVQQQQGSTIIRDWYVALAEWYFREIKDGKSAATCLLCALKIDSECIPALTLLANVQRQEKDSNLLDTLLECNRLQFNSLDALLEAAKLAALAPSAPRSLEVIEQLLRKAVVLWRGAAPLVGVVKAAEAAAFALNKLVDIHLGAGRPADACALLVDAAKLPFEQSVVKANTRRAADIYLENGKVQQAVEVLAGLVLIHRDDEELVRKVADLYEKLARLPESLHMRRKELDLCQNDERRLELRLTISSLLGRMEETGGRIESLRANLKDKPGHVETVDALAKVLMDRGRFLDLVELLEGYARLLEKEEQPALAASTWAQVAKLCEEHLRNIERAIAAHCRVVELHATPEALDALARMHTDKAEFVTAVDWIARRLELAKPAEQVSIRLRLARAQLKAERMSDAVTTLEAAFAEAPRNAEVCKLLFGLYRRKESWDRLVAAISTASEHITDKAALLSYAEEVAQLSSRGVVSPAAAVTVLQKASSIDQENKQLRTILARGLLEAGKLDEAREHLEALIESFGRRRSVDRSDLHVLLAKVAHGQGKIDEAIDQLEIAAKIDTGNTSILRTLAEMAREAGQLARAEKSYRTLLMAARRRISIAPGEPTDQPLAMGLAEVYLELVRISKDRGDTVQATELVESALESLGPEDEAERLCEQLQSRGDFDLLMRVLEKRLQIVDKPRRKALLLSQIAELQAGPLGKPDEAFESLLTAVREYPGLPTLHDKAQEVAAIVGQASRYAQELEELLNQSRRDSDSYVRCELFLRLGEVTELQVKDFTKAEEYYAQAEATGVRKVDVWRAKARVAGAQGRTAEQTELLERLASLGAAQVENRADALYRLAEIQLSNEETLDDGVTYLCRALEDRPNYERACSIVEAAVRSFPTHAALLSLYEEVSHASGNKAMLLGYLEQRALRDDATVEEIKLAVDIATSIGEESRAENLMQRAVDVGRESLDGLPCVGWALLGLAESRRRAGDVRASLNWLAEAVDAVDPLKLLTAGAQSAKAAAETGEVDVAIRFYERLVERLRTLRGAWEPLVDLYRQTGDLGSLERLVAETVDSLELVDERNALRLKLASALIEGDTDPERARPILEGVLAEDPENQLAQRLLIAQLEKAGNVGEVIELLRNQLMYAQGRDDMSAIREMALHLGRLLLESSPSDAADIYRQALHSLPTDRELLLALLAILDEEQEKAQRAELLERLVGVQETERETVEDALKAAAILGELGDEEGVLRVLLAGYGRFPTSGELFDRVRDSYAERGDAQGLCEVLVEAANRSEDERSKVALFKEAARVRRDELSDPSGAIVLLDAACEAAPQDTGLLREIAASLSALGRTQEAIARMTQLVQGAPKGSEDRRDLLLARGRLYLKGGDEDLAVGDLEEAYAYDPTLIGPELTTAYEQQRDRSEGNLARWKELTAKLVRFLSDRGEHGAVRAILAQWIKADAQDIEALSWLTRLDVESENWHGVLATGQRLVSLLEGAAQTEMALEVAQAAEKVGDPEQAKESLELVRRQQPGDKRIRERLMPIYEAAGASANLAELLVEQASEGSGPEAAAVFKRAGQLLLDAGKTARAGEVFERAIALDPEDENLVLEMVRTKVASGELNDAERLIDKTLAAIKDPRSTLVAKLKQQLANIEGLRGNMEGQLAMLKDAYASDRNNADILCDLADLSERMDQDNLAIKVLRAIILFEGPCRINHVQAYLRQGRIWLKQGDERKALQWAQRAKQEAPGDPEVKAFLRNLGHE